MTLINNTQKNRNQNLISIIVSLLIFLPVILDQMGFRVDWKNQRFPLGQNIPTFAVHSETSNQINREAHIDKLKNIDEKIRIFETANPLQMNFDRLASSLIKGFINLCGDDILQPKITALGQKQKTLACISSCFYNNQNQFFNLQCTSSPFTKYVNTNTSATLPARRFIEAPSQSTIIPKIGISNQTLQQVNRGLVVSQSKFRATHIVKDLEVTPIIWNGVYAFTVETLEGDAKFVYIGLAGKKGSTTCINSRLTNHIEALDQGNHHNDLFQTAFSRNPDSFKVYVLEAGPHFSNRQTLKDTETKYIEIADHQQPNIVIQGQVSPNTHLLNKHHVRNPMTITRLLEMLDGSN